VRERRDKAARALRALIEEHGGWFEDVEDRAFAASGTLVATVIAVIQIPASVQHPAGEPVRVTTDRTAWRDPLFHAATARPGVYVRYDPWRCQDTIFRFTGACAGCGASTWAHDHGDDDVRGPFAEHTCVALTRDDFPGAAPLPGDARFPGAPPAGTTPRAASGHWTGHCAWPPPPPAPDSQRQRRTGAPRPARPTSSPCSIPVPADRPAWTPAAQSPDASRRNVSAKG
jgi:hypothetical protein